MPNKKEINIITNTHTETYMSLKKYDQVVVLKKVC